MNKHIYILLTLLLTLVGCSKEPFDGIETEGQLRIGVEMLDRYYSEEIETRSGTFDANEREKKLFDDKCFVFVFYNTTEKKTLQQIVTLQKDTEGYFAILEATNSAVTVKGVANVDIPADILTKIDNKTLVIGDLANIYTTYTTENNILKSNDTGLLPKSSNTLSLSKIDALTVSGQKLEFEFDYVRVDVTLPTGTDEYPKLLNVYAMNAPALPLSTTKITKTHAVAPTGTDTKSVQGLYLYPNATSDLWSKDDAISIMLKIEASEGVFRYYKILIQHPSGTGKIYDIQRDYRYFINIISLTSDGYATEDEAIAAPHSNIDYNITYDDNSTHIVDNGQYYIGASKDKYWAKGLGYESHMLHANPKIEILTSWNDDTFVRNTDGTYSVEIAFTLGDGDGGGILHKLSGDVTLPDGASFSTETPLADNWKTITTEQEYTIILDENFTEGDIIIKLGELTQTIKLTVDKCVVTDYTDKTIVEQLTGLPDGYGGVTGLRVANSYIIVPDSGAETIFYIPITDRINEFWGNNGYANNAAYTIIDGALGEFSVEPLWYDQTNNPLESGVEIEKALSPVGKSAIKVTIPKAYSDMGNILVAVKKGSDIVWSWHLWVTDYNPYKTTSFENPNRTTVNETVSTIGGKIHSYNGTIWSSGIYKDKLIMDRNLGGISAGFAGQGSSNYDKGYIVYQFGRKEPFAGNTGKKSTDNTKFDPTINDRAIRGMEDATNNPLIFAINQGFSDFGGNTYLWGDPKATVANTNNLSGRQKSIFDPSPVGWRVPINGVYTFTHSSLPWVNSNDRIGRVYTQNNSVYYTANGYRAQTSAALIGATTLGLYWVATPASSTFAYRFVFDSSSFHANSDGRSVGFAVRPIQE